MGVYLFAFFLVPSPTKLIKEQWQPIKRNTTVNMAERKKERTKRSLQSRSKIVPNIHVIINLFGNLNTQLAVYAFFSLSLYLYISFTLFFCHSSNSCSAAAFIVRVGVNFCFILFFRIFNIARVIDIETSDLCIVRASHLYTNQYIGLNLKICCCCFKREKKAKIETNFFFEICITMGHSTVSQWTK